MPTTKDGKEFPYTADGILAAKRHEEFLRKANDQRTMDNSTNGEKTDKDKMPPYVKPRHLDPNHPMNREGNTSLDDSRTPQKPPQQYASKEPSGEFDHDWNDRSIMDKKKPVKKKPNPSMYG